MAFAKKGMNVMLISRTESKLKDVVTEIANTANSGPQICFRMKVAIGILFLPPPNQ